MKKIRRCRFWLIGLTWCLLVSGLALGSGDQPTVERQVLPGGPGGNRLEVDIDLLAGAASGFRDLRFFSDGGEEVPYLLLAQPTTDRKWQHGEILPVQRTRTTSGFEVDLGRLVTIDRVRIEGLPAPFLKRVRIEAGGDRSRWTLLYEQATLFDLPDDDLTLLELDFKPGVYRYLRVVWNDRSSARLPQPKRVAARLLEGSPPPPPLEVDLPFEKRASQPGRSRYRIALPAAGLPIVGLELKVETPYVLRQATVTEARLAGSEIRPSTLGQATLRRVVRDDVVASSMEIRISRSTETEIEIEIVDGDNPPLELNGITARFATQPWIYFESPDGSPINARYGARGLRAPAYDLAALREAVGSEVLAREVQMASFGPSRSLPVASIREEPDLAESVGGGAEIDPDGFQYQRAIDPGPNGLCAVRLDPAVLAGINHLGEIRIVDKSSHQVPYIQETLGEPTILDLDQPEPRPEDSSGKQSVYGLTLPFASLPEARLTIETTARVFERQVRLARLESRNPRDPPVRVILDEAHWRNTHPNSHTPKLTLRVPAHSGTSLLLIIDEGDNSPLEIANPRVYLPTYRLRFIRRTEEPLWLIYGREGIAAPRYDLALLAPRVLGSRVPEVGLAEAGEQRPFVSPDRIGRIVFWAVLILVLVVLFGLMARMLRHGPDEE